MALKTLNQDYVVAHGQQERPNLSIRMRIVAAVVGVIAVVTVILVVNGLASDANTSAPASKEASLPQDSERLAERVNELFTVDSVPQIFLTAKDAITKKDDYKDLRISIKDEAHGLDETTGEIKPRGNSTYLIGLEYGVMPYKIKLDEAADLLGMGKHKKWCLLPNFIDRSYVRQFVAFNMARLLVDEQYYQPKAKYVEVYMNNEYQGLYLLTESVEEDDGGLDIETDFAELGDDIPFLLEMENRKAINLAWKPEELRRTFDSYLFYADAQDDYPYWLTDNTDPGDDKFPTPMMLKYPASFDEISPSQAENMKSSIRNLYAAVSRRAPLAEIDLDIDAMISAMIFCEITYCPSCLNGASQFLYRQQGKSQIIYGPLWDFDYAMSSITHADFFTKSSNDEWPHLYGNALYLGLLDNSEYNGLLKRKFKEYYEVLFPLIEQEIVALKSNDTLKQAVLKAESKYHTWTRSLNIDHNGGIVKDYSDDEAVAAKTYEQHVDIIYGRLFGEGGHVEWVYRHLNEW